MADNDFLYLFGEINTLKSEIRELRELFLNNPGFAKSQEPIEWMDADEAAKFLKITKNTLRKYMKLKKIRFFQDERKVLFKKSDLEKYLNNFLQ